MKQKTCLYTSQKLKKKKIWHEGLLNIYAEENKCVLFASDDNCIRIGTALETRFLNNNEMNKLLTGKSSELECDGHLIQVEEEIIKANEQKLAAIPSVFKGPKAKFKPPARITPKLPVNNDLLHAPTRNNHMMNNNNMNNLMNMNNGRGYSVDDDELDELWGTSTSIDTSVRDDHKSNSTNNNQNHNPSGKYQNQSQSQSPQTQNHNPYLQSYQTQNQTKSQSQPKPQQLNPTATSFRADTATSGHKRRIQSSSSLSGQSSTISTTYGRNTGNKLQKVEPYTGAGVAMRKGSGHDHSHGHTLNSTDLNSISHHHNENNRNNSCSTNLSNSNNNSSNISNYMINSVCVSKTQTSHEGYNAISLYSDPYAAAKTDILTATKTNTDNANANDGDIWSD